MRTMVVVFGLAMLCGCSGASWYNPQDPYMKPGSEGTPSERTGGTLPPNEHKPLYPGWVSRLHAEGLDRPLVARR
ncbi:MAG TPA: hypothetical protein VKV17_12160 [Bryobacteraceae bacterium]|nr:hypothetical protein [Bryobacteraceae bacterium]